MDVAPLYLQVIRNVVEGVRADFSTEQLDEAALDRLAKLWEQKVLESGFLRSFDPETDTEVRYIFLQRAALFDAVPVISLVTFSLVALCRIKETFVMCMKSNRSPQKA